MTNRMDQFNKLKEKESTKINFENVLSDINQYGFKKGFITFEIKDDYTFSSYRKYEGNRVKFNVDLIRRYIEDEIDLLEYEITEILEGLK